MSAHHLSELSPTCALSALLDPTLPQRKGEGFHRRIVSERFILEGDYVSCIGSGVSFSISRVSPLLRMNFAPLSIMPRASSVAYDVSSARDARPVPQLQ
jgi:hypothetical protein